MRMTEQDVYLRSAVLRNAGPPSSSKELHSVLSEVSPQIPPEITFIICEGERRRSREGRQTELCKD